MQLFFPPNQHRDGVVQSTKNDHVTVARRLLRKQSVTSSGSSLYRQHSSVRDAGPPSASSTLSGELPIRKGAPSGQRDDRNSRRSIRKVWRRMGLAGNSKMTSSKIPLPDSFSAWRETSSCSPSKVSRTVSFDPWHRCCSKSQSASAREAPVRRNVVAAGDKFAESADTRYLAQCRPKTWSS